MSTRDEILKRGIELTMGNRNSSYGDPLVNLGLAGALKMLIRDWMQIHGIPRDMSPGEIEALDQVLTKVARIYTGRLVVPDNYIDGATYFAIAGELAARAPRLDDPVGPILQRTPEPASEPEDDIDGAPPAKVAANLIRGRDREGRGVSVSMNRKVKDTDPDAPPKT